MGCDIHIVMERKREGSPEWLGLWSSDELPGGRPKIAQRDYCFFAHFGVRGRVDAGVIYPRNIPEDVSRLAWSQYMRAPTDYHSPSYATVQEFVDAYMSSNPNSKEFRQEFAAYDLLGLDSDWPEGVEYRLVFWFDN